MSHTRLIFKIRTYPKYNIEIAVIVTTYEFRKVESFRWFELCRKIKKIMMCHTIEYGLLEDRKKEHHNNSNCARNKFIRWYTRVLRMQFKEV